MVERTYELPKKTKIKKQKKTNKNKQKSEFIAIIQEILFFW